MSSRSTKPVIFISYSHLDEPEEPAEGEVQWLTFVQRQLAPAAKNGVFELWVDKDIPGGDEWKVTIKRKLYACDICVLLVSPNSLASDYIIDIEIETIKERKKTDEVHLFPIVIEPISRLSVPWLADLQLRPKNGSLSDLVLQQRKNVMVEIVDEIAGIANAIAERKFAAKIAHADIDKLVASDRVFMDVRSDLKRDTLERLLARPTASDVVDIAHLPETAYEQLRGREAELQQLDEAWTDPKINILSLVAGGGAGKTALVHEWLKRLQLDNYRGAERVLGWSFYSQGSKERATSADTFLNWALAKLGVTFESTSASAKGEKIAEELASRRILLVLDGVEPLQHGPGPQVGQLKDLGLRTLLRRFVAIPPGEQHRLIVLSGRLPVKDIGRWKHGAAPVLDLGRLSDEAGAELLRDNGVWGTDKELRQAAHDFHGHALGLSLLASYLKQAHFGDVRRRDRVRAFLAGKDAAGHDHARRVMESYETEWLRDHSVLRSIMHMVGLFDRPASGDCLTALRVAPKIPGLTDVIVRLDDTGWNAAVSQLREVRLIDPIDLEVPDTLDAHPLVREWFGERLRQTNEQAWRAAHLVVYDHLRRTTREGENPTLEALAPLYQAISHGCRAGRHQDVLEKVYVDRICRRTPDGRIKGHARFALGAVGSDLAAVYWFFERPYETPFQALSNNAQAWVLGDAAFSLSCQGRFGEALPLHRAALEMGEMRQDWNNAARSASNLSHTQFCLGELEAALDAATTAVAYAKRTNDKPVLIGTYTYRAEVLLATGNTALANSLFKKAENLVRKMQPSFPMLSLVPGYRFYELLLAQGKQKKVCDRATHILARKVGTEHLLGQGLELLALGRAHHALALESINNPAALLSVSDHTGTATSRLDDAIEDVRGAGHMDHLAGALLARAAFRRSVGNRDGAARDLDEVEEIAEPGPMRLYLCDMAIERARLAFARVEAFAPPNALIDESPPKPTAPDAAEAARLKEEARANLAEARKLITECGYHRRDEELAELEAVLAGTRRFADLPPRV